MEKSRRRVGTTAMDRITVRMAASGYQVADQVSKSTQPRAEPFNDLEAELRPRLSNWRAALRSSSGARSGNCCTAWAAAYVSARNAQEMKLAIELQLIKPDSRVFREDNDELDGWLVEAAVRVIPFPDQREALRLRYVWDYSNHFMKSKLRVNDTSLRIVIARSLSSLQKVLASLQPPARIRANNLHAGIVPSLEALAVPVGTAAPLESKAALID